MAVFKVKIEGFGELPVTPPFLPQTTINRRPNGQVQSVEESWTFRGVLAADGSGASGLRDKRNSLLTAFQKTTAKVEFTVDGSSFYEISSAKHARGAFFRNFQIEETGGEWVNLLSYRFEVVGEQAIAIANILETTKTVTIAEEDGEAEVTINVSARGPGALAYVQGQKPPGAKRSVIVQTIEEDTADGTFTIPFNADEETFDIEEEVEIQPGLFPLEMVRTTRSSEPKPFWSSKEPTRIFIRGTITTTSGRSIAPPIGEKFAKFAQSPRISRNVTGRAGASDPSDEPTDSITYSIEFHVPFDVTMEELLEDRRAFATGSFEGDEGSGFSVAG